ncbi:MAG: dockerin type I domain-containing protein [Clostridiales bacterium]|nr:dockerin type I domain-containing protein [Clostridiales bacterium]
MNPDKTIFRAELIQRMKTASAGKHLFLAAPGGYGKTVAAVQWLFSLRNKAEIIVVGDADNDADVFYRRLARALLTLTGKAKTLSKADMTFDQLLETVRRLPVRSPRVYLLIDDMHALKNEEVVSSLPRIVSHLPPYVGLCMASRSDPPASLPETGRFEVLTQRDFLFAPEEIASLGAEKGRSLTPEECQNLLESTGGWAMYLSALLSGRDFDETPQTLTEYLEKRVWAQWGDGVKTSLLRLAVPRRVTPELAERLTGQADGAGLLTRLAKVENAFLSPVEEDVYRFHDIFRDFLLERLEENLGKEEIRRLNDVTAEWHYQRGDYFHSIRYYFKNRDHEGIIRCERAITVYEETENVSIEASYHFVSQNVLYMPVSFIRENPFLIVECCCAALWGGDIPDFFYWKDKLDEKLPEIAEKYPDLLETAGFLGSLDPRVPMLGYAERLAVMMPSMGARETDSASTNTVTHNLPFFHRSMRDLSEVYELKEEDLRLLRNTFGVMIGEDYKVMEHSLIAGIYYERGELLLAANHAMKGYFACTGDTHPETWFSARVILAAALLCGLLPLMAAASGIDITQDFTDLKFRARVYVLLGKADTEPIYDSDVEGIEELWVGTRGIESLAGLQHFTSLKILGCYDNELAALPALPAGLEELYCANNQLASLPALPAGLTHLSVSGNRLTALPALPENMESLFCFDNSLIALPPLPPGLRHLSCFNNQLAKLDISSLASLEDVSCRRNLLTGLALNSFAAYRRIDVSFNYMANEAAVTGKPVAWDGDNFIFSPQLSPVGSVVVGIHAPDASYVGKDAEFSVSLANAANVLSVELAFECDGGMLVAKSFTGRNGFEATDVIRWAYLGDNLWKGSLALGYMPGNDSASFSSIGLADIASIVFTPKTEGETALALSNVKVAGKNGVEVVNFDAVAEPSTAMTAIEWVYSRYDLTRDGIVDALDLGIMLLYCGFDKDSPQWGTYVKANDSKGKGVTAKTCDVNGDGVIDMLDLLDLIVHFGSAL